jgi:hypothetical protein
MNNLTKPQEVNLKLLRETFGVGKWFTENKVIEDVPERINRVRFVLETLWKKDTLTREMNPERDIDFEFYRYKIK